MRAWLHITGLEQREGQGTWDSCVTAALSPVINVAKEAHSSGGLAQGHTDNKERAEIRAQAHGPAHSLVGLLGREGGLSYSLSLKPLWLPVLQALLVSQYPARRRAWGPLLPHRAPPSSFPIHSHQPQIEKVPIKCFIRMGILLKCQVTCSCSPFPSL